PPLGFLVDDADSTAAFLAPRAENLIRASVPPDRIGDVHVYVGTLGDLLANRPTVAGNPSFDALSRTYLSAIREAESRAVSPPITFVLAPFAQPDFADALAAGRLVGPSTAVIRSSDVVESAPEPVPFDTLRPSAPLLTIATAMEIVLVLLVAGYGWARAAFLDPTNALALSPAFGVAALILAGLVFER